MMNFHEIIGNFGNCTSKNPCGEDEGDCNNDSQCKEGNKCGTSNCRDSLGFHIQIDCCYSIEEDFCTLENPCSVDEGDCDSHDVCQGSLVCGLNNCPKLLGYDSVDDCCYNATLGGEDFCSTENPCAKDEGDCDSDNECQDTLVCGLHNCPNSPQFSPDVDCCWDQSICQYPDYIGDSYCDDGNNNEECGWDDGDCCGDYVNTDYCYDCFCLDPDDEDYDNSQSRKNKQSEKVEKMLKNEMLINPYIKDHPMHEEVGMSPNSKLRNI